MQTGTRGTPQEPIILTLSRLCFYHIKVFNTHIQQYITSNNHTLELYVLLSDVAVAVMAYTLYSLATIYGAYNLFLFYGIPYLICNFVYVRTNYFITLN